MKKELREIYDFGKLQIITEKSKLPKYALAKLSYSFAKADSQNANHRTYSEKILSREINRKSEELRKGKIAGQLEHPFSGSTRLDKVAHVLSNVHYDRCTKLASAESFILDTSKGRDFMVMLDAELKMGVSMRGFGNVVDGKVQSDWKLDTCDFVLHPSFGSDATIDQSNIIESANGIFEEENLDDEQTEDREQIMYELLQASYGTALTQGFQGDFDLYSQLHESGLRKVMHLPENKRTPTQRIADAEVQVSERI